jgi:hypothetical protein
MVLTAEQQAELRAKKALETGDASFKPRGKANKAIFEKMKEEFDKKAKDINLHTSSEADRIIAATATAVLEVIGKHTQPNPGQTRMAAVMAGPSTAVKVLNSILSDQGIECKGTKTDKAEFLANTIPVHRLVKLLEEHKNCAMSKPKAKAKPKADSKASSATASTAAPSEQLESEGEPMKNQSSDSDESSDEDLPMKNQSSDEDLPMENQSSDSGESSDEEEPMPPAKATAAKAASLALPRSDEESSDESSDEEEPMPPAKATPAKITPTQPASDVVYLPCKRRNADTNQQFEKIKVVFNKSCTDAEKEKITSPETPYAKVVDILKSCSSDEGGMWRFKRQVNNLQNTGDYCVDGKLENEDTFSVSLRNIHTFKVVCMLSLV